MEEELEEVYVSTWDVANDYCSKKLGMQKQTYSEKDCIRFVPSGFEYKDFHLRHICMETKIRMFWNDKQLLVSPQLSHQFPHLLKEDYLMVTWLALHLDLLMAWHLDLFKPMSFVKLRVRPYIPSLKVQLNDCFPIAHTIWLDRADSIMDSLDLPF